MISPFQSLVTRLSAVFGRIGPQPPRQRWGVSARAAIWYCKAVLWLFGAPLVIGALLSYFSYKSILVYRISIILVLYGSHMVLQGRSLVV